VLEVETVGLVNKLVGSTDVEHDAADWRAAAKRNKADDEGHAEAVVEDASLLRSTREKRRQRQSLGKERRDDGVREGEKRWRDQERGEEEGQRDRGHDGGRGAGKLGRRVSVYFLVVYFLFR
jgi:hypothetical protein